MLVSIQRHYRGFNYQQEYETKEHFNADMEQEHKGNDEVCWAHLFDEHGGMVATYRRGYAMAEYV